MSKATPCEVCGEHIQHEVGKPGRRRKYHRTCDPHGRRATPLSPRECGRCAESFQPVSELNTYCSRACQGYQPVANAPRLCQYSECGQPFTPRTTRQMSCSPAHARKAWQERNLERDADVRRNMYHRRRARKKGTTSGDPVIRSEIAERDEWTCHLCDSAIPTAAKWPSPLSLSLDHVIPLSRGGIHDPSNVKAAHLRCNIAKGDRLAA